MGHDIAGTHIMVPAQGLARDRNILAASVTRTRRLGEIHTTTWPQLVLDTIYHAHDLGAQVLVRVQWQGRGKLSVGPDGRKVVFAPNARQCRFLDQAHQLTLLNSVGMVDVPHMFLQAIQKMATDQWREVEHRLQK